jgi:hypothetical protein
LVSDEFDDEPEGEEGENGKANEHGVETNGGTDVLINHAGTEHAEEDGEEYIGIEFLTLSLPELDLQNEHKDNGHHTIRGLEGKHGYEEEGFDAEDLKQTGWEELDSHGEDNGLESKLLHEHTGDSSHDKVAEDSKITWILYELIIVKHLQTKGLEVRQEIANEEDHEEGNQPDANKLLRLNGLEGIRESIKPSLFCHHPTLLGLLHLHSLTLQLNLPSLLQ